MCRRGGMQYRGVEGHFYCASDLFDFKALRASMTTPMTEGDARLLHPLRSCLQCAPRQTQIARTGRQFANDHQNEILL